MGGTACRVRGGERPPETIRLPEVRAKGSITVEDALEARRSVREYSDEPVALEDLSLLLWAAQGETAGWGGRTAPSAGALFPMEVVVVAGEVSGLDPGVYRYRNQTHALVPLRIGDRREALADEALGQAWVREAPVVLVLSAVYDRTMKKYGERGVRYAHIEAGAVAENIYLEAVSLGLGTVLTGAFHDDEVRRVLGLAREETPLALLPVGHPADR